MASFYHTNSKITRRIYTLSHLGVTFSSRRLYSQKRTETLKNAQKASIYKFSVCKHAHVFTKNTIKHVY